MEVVACLLVCLWGQSPADPFSAATSRSGSAEIQRLEIPSQPSPPAFPSSMPGDYPPNEPPAATSAAPREPLTYEPPASLPSQSVEPSPAAPRTVEPSKSADASPPIPRPTDDDPIQREKRQRAEQHLAELYGHSDEPAFEGQLVHLSELLSPMMPPPQQIEITHQYWQVAAAMAECRLAWDLRRKLDQVASLPSVADRGQLPWVVVAAQKGAESRLIEARLLLLSTQHRLLETTGVGTAERPPLAADMPHVGPYWTWFEQIYAGRPTPLTAARLNQTLPLRKQTIELTAEAIEAAYQHLDAVGQAFMNRQASLEELLAAVSRVDRQQQAFIVAVRDYNRDIAQYALAVPHSVTSPQRLTAMLIRPNHSGPVDASTADTQLANSEGVQPASLLNPIDAHSPEFVADRNDGIPDGPASNPLREPASDPQLPQPVDPGTPDMLPPAPDDARPLPPPHPFGSR